jgi:REP element-mobilizing transposase RayT
MFGSIARESLEHLPRRFPTTHLDEFVIMPDHVHALVFIDGRRDDESTDCSLGEIVGSYKSEVTRKINRLRGTPGQRVWTRNYHERIIRSNTVLTNARRYIQENVQKGMGQGRLSRTVSPWVGATRLYYRT